VGNSHIALSCGRCRLKKQMQELISCPVCMATCLRCSQVPVLHIRIGLEFQHWRRQRKVSGMIPDEVIGFYNLPNSSSHGVDSASNRNECQESS
jgi:hypothetical protein